MNHTHVSRSSWTLSRSFAVFGVVATMVACMTNPSAGEVIDKAAPVICDKARECNGDTVFAAAFGTRDECIKKTSEGVDRDATSACDDATIDKCLEDLKAAACPADKALPTLPCDC